MIAFHHRDAAEGSFPCDAGLHVCVMNSDRAGAQRMWLSGEPQILADDGRLAA